ncbi:MAG: CHAP domain-containing protein [Prevotella sp.]|nr:CHAP domain-containing protein [Prevotella sp.]
MKNKWKDKLTITALAVIGVVLIWNHLPYYYSNERTVDYITNHAEEHSRRMCAGYVVMAMWHGRCPIGPVVLPAYAYSKILPQIGFEEVPAEGYNPRKGDISVLPQNSRHVFGHIAVYDGKQWVSDFKQKSLFPSKAYQENGKYQVFSCFGWLALEARVDFANRLVRIG